MLMEHTNFSPTRRQTERVYSIGCIFGQSAVLLKLWLFSCLRIFRLPFISKRYITLSLRSFEETIKEAWTGITIFKIKTI